MERSDITQAMWELIDANADGESFEDYIPLPADMTRARQEWRTFVARKAQSEPSVTNPDLRRHLAAIGLPPLSEKQPELRPEQNKPTQDAIGPMTIQIDDQTLISSRPTKPKPLLRWLAAAAAVFVVVTLGILYRSMFPPTTPDPEKNIVKKDQNTPVLPDPVKQDSNPTDQQLKAFQEAVAALEKRASALDAKGFRAEYETLLKKYPDRKDEIEQNPKLAAALVKLPGDMEENPPKVPPPLPESDVLLAEVAKVPNPIRVSEEKVRDLRGRIVQFLAKNPDKPAEKLKDFVAAAELTPEHKFQYVETKAKQMNAVANPAAAEVQQVRNDILALRWREDTGQRVRQSATITEFIGHTKPTDRVVIATELKTDAVALLDRFPKKEGQSYYLISELPPDLRQEAYITYAGVQTYASLPGTELDPVLLEFLTKTRRPEDIVGMIIPFYVPPDPNKPGLWNDILALGKRGVPVKIVIGADVGPKINVPDRLYELIISAAHEHGIQVLGGVNCSGDPKSEVFQWSRLYPNQLDGLCFTNQNTDKQFVKIYADLYAFARAREPRWQIVAFPGSPCDEAFLSQTGADILCPSANGVGPVISGWEGKYAPARFAAFVTGVADETLVPGLVKAAVTKHFGWIYVEAPDATKQAPPYLEKQFALIQQINQAISAGAVAQNNQQPSKKQAPAAKTKPRTKN